MFAPWLRAPAASCGRPRAGAEPAGYARAITYPATSPSTSRAKQVPGETLPQARSTSGPSLAPRRAYAPCSISAIGPQSASSIGRTLGPCAHRCGSGSMPLKPCVV
jgi:hypothetical protein